MNLIEQKWDNNFILEEKKVGNGDRRFQSNKYNYDIGVENFKAFVFINLLLGIHIHIHKP